MKTSIRMGSTALLAALLCAHPAFSQAQINDSHDSTSATDTNGDTIDDGSAVSARRGDDIPDKPYTAKIVVDTHSPVTYGDDVVISVWISPLSGFDLKDIRLHPKGALTELYRSTDLDADDKPIPGRACRISVQNAHAGTPLVATCRLTGAATGLRRAFNWNAVLLSSESQQFEIEVIVREGARDTATYYEFGTIEFVSPMLSVIVGGLLGAALWSLFLPISGPRLPTPDVPVNNWMALGRGIWAALPHTLQRMWLFLMSVLRNTALGGVTALVLIILAKTTQGLETPIALQVQDLWGGLLVGIFSTPLSKLVRNKVERSLEAERPA